MDVFTLILLVVAAVCFVLAAANVGSPRVNLVALGLAFWVVSIIIHSPVFH